jgi:hypothetical protein
MLSYHISHYRCLLTCFVVCAYNSICHCISSTPAGSVPNQITTPGSSVATSSPQSPPVPGVRKRVEVLMVKVVRVIY